jgi:DNA polymerase III sliding clamp (beta) subunit (PCNA family)
LSVIVFEIKEGVLLLSSTDGFRVLQSELEIIENYGVENYKFSLSAELCSKLVFQKTEYIDEVIIRVDNDDTVEFYDEAISTLQTLKIRVFDYFPNINDVFSKEGKFKVGIVPRLIKDISSLSTSKGYFEICINTKDDTAGIEVYATSENLKQRAKIMPYKPNDEQ